MLRNPEARFMPGVWVFSGGAVDESERWPAGSSDADRRPTRSGAPRRGDPRARGGGRDRAGGRRRPAPVVAVDHARGRPGALRHPPSRSPRPTPRRDRTARRPWTRSGPPGGPSTCTPRTSSSSCSRRSSTSSRCSPTRAARGLDAVDAVEPVLPKVIERASRSASCCRAIPGTRTKIRGQVTSTLPQEVRDVFERFAACEYTRTVDSRQQPITWPVTPYYRGGAPSIDVTGLAIREEGA